MIKVIKFKSERDKFAFDEATKDPIFLFQRVDYMIGELPFDYCYCPDCEGIFHEPWDDHCEKHNDDEFDSTDELSNKELESLEIAKKVWITERVCYSRDEGNQYGESRHYNYPDGWRVYCVPATGQLVDILWKYDEKNGTFVRPASPIVRFLRKMVHFLTTRRQKR